MMKKLFSKLWANRRVIRSILKTIYFNFHYLPFRQAIKLPIILYKPKLLMMNGNIEIKSSHISFGMIKLGFPSVSIYPDKGIIYENKGGTIIFSGKCNIGGNSAISIGDGGGNKKPCLKFGDNFLSLTTLKIVCCYNIIFNDIVRFGWDCLVMDTDFHKLTKLSGGYTKGYGEIVIGKNNWFGTRCIVLKNTITPDYCTISASSLLNKKYDVPKYSIIGPSTVIELKKTDIYRNIYDDTIVYE